MRLHLREPACLRALRPERSGGAPALGAAGEVQADDVATLVVASPYASGGAVDIPHELEIERP